MNENGSSENSKISLKLFERKLESNSLHRLKSRKRSIWILKLLIILNVICLMTLLYFIFFVNLHKKQQYLKIDIQDIEAEDLELTMDCASIRRRIIGDRIFPKLARPIAVARNIYKDYITQEAFLALSYNPDNVYCFALDSKSQSSFATQMRSLEQCIANVHISSKTYDMTSSGHYQDRSHLDCLEILLERNKNWQHVLLLQNHDLIIKTPSELNDISQILNGTHAIGISQPNKNRYNAIADWTPKSLKIWKNETGKTHTQLYTPLTIGKNTNEAFLSRNFIEAIFTELNLEGLLSLFNDNEYYGVDEMFFHTLVLNSFMELPGQIRNSCDMKIRNLARWTHWDYDKDANICLSKILRHNICLLGVEYLPILAGRQEIVANKVMQQFDFGTIICMNEYFKKIESGLIDRKRNIQPYKYQPQVRQLRLLAEGDVNLTNFKC